MAQVDLLGFVHLGGLDRKVVEIDHLDQGFGVLRGLLLLLDTLVDILLGLFRTFNVQRSTAAQLPVQMGVTTA